MHRVWVCITLLLAFATGADASVGTKSEIGVSEGMRRKLLAAHQYRMREKVPLYANKAGPFHNPSEVRRRQGEGHEPDDTTRFRSHAKQCGAITFSPRRAPDEHTAGTVTSGYVNE